MIRKGYLGFSRILSSPFLLVAFSLTASVLGTILYKRDADLRAPEVPGYNWSRHPQALLLAYPLADACSSCNLSISGWAEYGLQHNLDVLVIATRNNRELDTLRNAQSGVFLVTDVDEGIIKKFSIGDKIGAVRVDKGRIVARQIGGSPSARLLNGQQRRIKS